MYVCVWGGCGACGHACVAGRVPAGCAHVGRLPAYLKAVHHTDMEKHSPFEDTVSSHHRFGFWFPPMDSVPLVPYTVLVI